MKYFRAYEQSEVPEQLPSTGGKRRQEESTLRELRPGTDATSNSGSSKTTAGNDTQQLPSKRGHDDSVFERLKKQKNIKPTSHTNRTSNSGPSSSKGSTNPLFD